MQTSLPPQIPKQSLAPVLIGFAGVIVAGVLGWKLLAGSTPEATEPASAAAAGAAAAVSERVPEPASDAPPPPPADEEKGDAPARAPAAAPGGRKAAKPEPSAQVPSVEHDPNCADPCRGKETPELLSALGAKAGQARSCYEKALSNNAALAGKLEVGVRVSPTGEACSAKVGKDSLADAAVTSCVLQRFRAGKYPKPTGGCVTVSVPMNFMPAGSR